MKTQLQNLAVAFMLTLLIPAFAIAQQFTDPVDYNNFIVGHQTEVVRISMEYISVSVHSEDERAIESKRQQVVKQLKKSINEVNRAEGYKGDNRLKNEAIDVFELYLNTYTTDFNEAELLKKDRQSSFTAMEQYFKAQERAEKKLAAASDQFSKAQDAFAKKYELTMVEGDGDNELENKIQIISDVNVYTRKLFLLYFKPFKIDAQFLDAFNEQKVSMMKSKRQELLQAADAGLGKLQLIGPFKTDKSYLKATEKLLETYVELCQGDYKELVSIIERKDKLTQEDVDRANEIIQNYNENITKLINDFNEANSTFMQKHIPKN